MLVWCILRCHRNAHSTHGISAILKHIPWMTRGEADSHGSSGPVQIVSKTLIWNTPRRKSYVIFGTFREGFWNCSSIFFNLFWRSGACCQWSLWGKRPVDLSLTHRGNLELPVNPTCMFLVCERSGKTSKFHTQSPQVEEGWGGVSILQTSGCEVTALKSHKSKSLFP